MAGPTLGGVVAGVGRSLPGASSGLSVDRLVGGNDVGPGGTRAHTFPSVAAIVMRRILVDRAELPPPRA
jgi:hypothetical protein